MATRGVYNDDGSIRVSVVDPTTGNASSGLTDTQLRASAVPVSGPLTDTQLRATPVKTVLDASATTGGVSGFKVLSAATTNATVVKAGPGRIYSVQLSNTSTSYRYIKFYNLATTPVVGTSTVLSIVGIPPGGRASLNTPQGIYCSAGIAFSIVVNPADADTTAVGANEIAGSITYL